MFERFTRPARTVVIGAQEVAGRRGAAEIGSEHLLIALVTGPESLGRTVLAAVGVDADSVEAGLDAVDDRITDRDALATLGIDLDEVRRQVEEAFGPGALDRTGRRRRGGGGHLPFGKDAKKVLELALREALRMEHNYIGTEHIVLGLLHTETGAARHVLEEKGMRLDAARVIVEELVRGRRAG